MKRLALNLWTYGSIVLLALGLNGLVPGGSDGVLTMPLPVSFVMIIGGGIAFWFAPTLPIPDDKEE